MSEVKVNKISPRTACGTVTLGDSGDTFTIPSGVTISNSGTAAGFGGTGEISWDTTVKTTGTFTATAGVGYFCNTTGGIITVNLPAGTAGDSVALADYAGTWQTNGVTVTPNGTDKIGGLNKNVGLETEGQSVTFVYIDGTQGWVNVLDSTSNVRAATNMAATGGNSTTTSGNYKAHIFTGPGTFCVSAISPSVPNNALDYLIVGGGGGGAKYLGGAGGAGGFRQSPGTATGSYTVSPIAGNSAITAAVQGYPIVVGGGGTASPSIAGSVSSFSCLTSAGGGRGIPGPSGITCPGGPGGSGGGASGYTPTGTLGGTGNTPPVSPPQGNPGGVGGAGCPGYPAGGGGGALAASAPLGGGQPGQAGGAGGQTNICGTLYYYSGGGGGAAYTSVNGGTGGDGGGGGGGTDTPGSGGAGGPGRNAGAAGTASPCGAGPSAGGAGGTNTGGGGGGGGYGAASCNGAAGGSGIVIIRYKYQN